jgi:protein phosphatase PTC1
VNGVLAISRALGDHMLKENNVVTAEPFTTATELVDDDAFLIMACDGLWDVMSDQVSVCMCVCVCFVSSACNVF